MSKLQELINELCPNGVEYKKIGDICDVITGGEAPSDCVKGDCADENHPYAVWGNGKEVYGYASSYKIDKDAVVISSIGANTGTVYFRKAYFTPIIRLKVVLPKNGLLDTRFLYYALSNTKIESKKSSVPNMNANDIKAIIISVPPIEVQHEIVNILDKYTAAIEELVLKLERELDARKKQYEYYKQMCFDRLENCQKVKITDIAIIKARVGWQRLTKAEYLNKGDYYLITGTDFVSDGSINFNSCVYVSEERFNMDENIKVHRGDVLITKDGTLGKVALISDEPPKPTTLNSGVFRIAAIDDSVDTRYLYHFFTSKYFVDFVESVKTGSTIPHLTQQGLLTLDIPLPNRDKQEKIIDTLDRVMQVYSEAYRRLEEEIEARRKQYEYYRNTLLSFKEVDR